MNSLFLQSKNIKIVEAAKKPFYYLLLFYFLFFSCLFYGAFNFIDVLEFIHFPVDENLGHF